jgi:cytochrome P450
LERVTDPAAVYAELRNVCPVHRFDSWGPPLFSLSRYDDVKAVLRDPRRWSSRLGQGPWRTLEPGIRTDPPEHIAYRRAINTTLSAQVVSVHAEGITTVVERAVASLPRAFDVLDDLVAVVVGRVFAPVLGLTEAETWALWAATLEALGSPETAPPGVAVSFDRQKAKPAWRMAREQLIPHIERRRSAARRPLDAPTDLIEALVEGRDRSGSPFPDDAIVQVVMLVLFGAIHTTSTLLTNACLKLLDDRSEWAAICAEPALAAVAIEESARLEAPVPGIYRTAVSETRLHGVEIPEQAKVRALFAAANRDPRMFSEPDQFRLDRDPVTLARDHLSFGHGVHVCVGAPLARLQGRILIAVLTQRLPQLELAGLPRWWTERDAITLTQPHGLAPARNP